MAGKNYHVKDLRLADGGRKRILWAGQDMMQGRPPTVWKAQV